jgi:UDP-3-O-[3-hydroxymyristoyl] glucosamine N-acyltransferase
LVSHSIADIAAQLGGQAVGQTDLIVTRPREPAAAGPGDLALAMDPKFATGLAQSRAEAAVLWADADWQSFGLKAAILVGRSRYAMSGITTLFDLPAGLAPGIHPMAVIDPSAEIGAGAAIGPFVVIGAHVRIGAGARILSHVSIAEDVVIGQNALIHAGVRIGARVRIGDRFIAQPGCVIGSDGFSFVTPEPNAVEEMKRTGRITGETAAPEWTRINSLGAVRIGDDVEIGANAAIDRGTVSDTTIGNGTKLDNLVHIGHNVQIGETTLICGQVGIAGSAVIGDRVVLAGQVGVADHVTVGSDVIAGAQAGITNTVKPETMVMGYPAQPREQFMRGLKSIRRVPMLSERVAAVEKRVPNEDVSG